MKQLLAGLFLGITKLDCEKATMCKKPVNPAIAYTEITLSKLRSRLSETLNRVQYGKECVLVTNYGKKVAQLLPVPEE